MISKSKNIYLPELDGLRAFAVIIVIINHFNKELLPSGFLGVDIFFLISGYVITSSLLRRPAKNFGEFISSFYFRRIKRILPALIFCVLVTSIFLCFFNHDPEYEIKTAGASLLGLSNIYLIKISTNYFSTAADINPFLHTWSLGVEEQFYFCFPLIFWLLGFNSRKRNFKKYLFIGMISLAILSLLLFIFIYPINKDFVYYSMPTRFWEIAAGCLLFLVVQKNNIIVNKLKSIPPTLIFTLIISLLLLPIEYFLFSVFSIILLTSLLIISLDKNKFLYRIFTNQNILFIGLISYSLYLWHWPIISISRITIGIQWWTLPFQITAIILFTLFSYYFIEKPIRNNKSFLNNKKNTYILSFSSLFLAVISVYSLSKNTLFFYLGNKELIKFSTVFKIKINNKILQDNECQSNLVFKGARPQCIVLPKDKRKTNMYLFGDSHMQHYLPLFEYVNQVKGYGYIFHGRSGIPLGKRKNINSGFVDETINRYVIDETIKNLSKNDIFIISERHERNFAPKMLDGDQNKNIFFNKDKEISKTQALDRYSLYLKSLFKKIDKRGATLVVFQPTTSFRGTTLPPNICRQKFASLNPDCKEGLSVNRKMVLDNLSGIRSMHLRIAEETNQGIKVFDPFEIICPPKRKECTQILNKTPLYMDNDHLSEEGALLIKTQFLQFLNKIE